MPKSRYWIDLSTRDVAELPPDTIAILPVGAVEQHGPHMPLGTDAIINRGIVARALELVAADVSVIVLPEQTVGTSSEHLSFPGTLSHMPTALIGIWTTVLECTARAGIGKLLIFNSHGGQVSLLQPVALDIRRRLGVLCAYASWFDAGYPAGLFTPEEEEFGIHAGAIETAMMMHLRPELVDAASLADFPSRALDFRGAFSALQADPGNGRLGGFGWMAEDLNRFGAMGDASAATPEAGRKLVDHAAGKLATLLGEIGGIAPDFLASDTFLSRGG